MNELRAVMKRRASLVRLYEGLQRDLVETRAKLKSLPLVGHYPPNARLYDCERCAEGPFNAHEIRLHRPKCKGK